jgi:hypothetical protein
MGYGPGVSARVWAAYFTHPDFQLWEAEVDAACAARSPAHPDPTLFATRIGPGGKSDA